MVGSGGDTSQRGRGTGNLFSEASSGLGHLGPVWRTLHGRRLEERIPPGRGARVARVLGTSRGHPVGSFPLVELALPKVPSLPWQLDPGEEVWPLQREAPLTIMSAERPLPPTPELQRHLRECLRRQAMLHRYRFEMRDIATKVQLSNNGLHQTRRGGAAASRPVVARDDDVGFLSPVTDPGPWTDSR